MTRTQLNGGFMKRISCIISMLLAVLLIAGCATLNLGSDATNDEKARAGISDALDTLDIGMTTAATYVAINPARKGEYQAQVLPLLSVANDMIGDAIVTGSTGGTINGPQIALQASGYAIRVAAIIASWQALDQAPKSRAMKAAVTPSWMELQGNQKYLAARIQAELNMRAKVKK